jgi:hypothetical protein
MRYSDSRSPIPPRSVASLGGTTFSLWKREGLPGSWGTPCVHALLLDPGGISTSAHGRVYEPSQTPNFSAQATTGDHASFRLLTATLRRVDVAFRNYQSVGSHEQLISRLNHTACTLAWISIHRVALTGRYAKCLIIGHF